MKNDFQKTRTLRSSPTEDSILRPEAHSQSTLEHIRRPIEENISILRGHIGRRHCTNILVVVLLPANVELRVARVGGVVSSLQRTGMVDNAVQTVGSLLILGARRGDDQIFEREVDEGVDLLPPPSIVGESGIQRNDQLSTIQTSTYLLK